MNLKISNNAVARLAAPITASQTSFSLQAGQGAKFPTLGENDYFTLTAVKPDTSLEIMYVTARSFDVLTVLRGQENTAAQAFDALTVVENRITAKSIMDEIQLNRSIVAAALTAFQPSVPVGIDQLRILLLNALGPDQLTADLRSRIALIDGSSAVGGSVNQRVKNATDAFFAALTQEAADRTTYVQQYAFSKQGTNAAISAQASVTRAEFTAYADAARLSAINTSTAYVNSYTYTAADIRNAISASEQTLRAEFSGGTGGASYATQAYVQSYAYSIAQADGAIAAQTLDLRTTVGNNTAAIQTATTTLNGLSAQVYTKIDVNGYVTGYGLASTGATSEFVVRAERFKFVGPDNNPQPLFVINTINGQARAVLRGTLALGGSPDNIIPDPAFHDLIWWGRSTTGSAGYWSDNGQATLWGGGASLYLNPSSSESISYSTPFPITPGAVYSVQCQVELSNNFNGRVSVFLTVPGAVDYSMVNRTTGLTWSDGLPVQLRDTSPKGNVTFTTTFTAPSGATFARGLIQLRNSHTVGTVEVGGISITRMSDNVLIADGAVTANKVSVNQLSALSAFLGTVDVGVGGYLRSGQTTFNVGSGFFLGSVGGVPKLSIGNPNGNRLTYDGTDFKIFVNPGANVSISPQSAVFSFSSNVQYTNTYVGSYTASLSNSTATRLSYSWSLSPGYSGLSLSINGSPNVPQITVSATFKFLDQEIDSYATCTITDLDAGSSYHSDVVITISAPSNP